MYTCRLDIRIFSADPLPVSAMREVAPPERFEHAFSVRGDVAPDAVGEGDVVVLDASLGKRPEDVRKFCKENAVLIFCAEQAEIAALPSASYEALDEIWTKPFAAGFVKFQFGKLLRMIRLRRECRLAQTYLDTVIDSVPDLVWFKDLRGAHLKVNNSFCRAVGKTKQDVEGRGHCYIWDLDQEEYAKGEYVCLESEEIVLAKRKTCLFDEKVKSQQGLRQFKTYKSPLFDEDGSVMGTVGIAHDVTDLANMGAEFEIILRNMPFAILISDTRGIIVNVNTKFEEYFGLGEQDVVGTSYAAWRDAALRNMEAIGKDYAEVTVSCNGETRILEIHEEPIFDIFQNLVGQFCICRDATIEHAFEEQILRSANTDALTGLYNRRFFHEFIDKNRETQPVSLLYLDLDNFKRVNDIHGHQAGDEALITVADLMREYFPEDFPVRLGGDEFLICVLGACDLSRLRNRAEQFLRRLRACFQAMPYLRSLSASIGIAVTADPGLEIAELIRRSDIAMYEAKQAGKSQCRVYTPELQMPCQGLFPK